MSSRLENFTPRLTYSHVWQQRSIFTFDQTLQHFCVEESFFQKKTTKGTVATHSKLPEMLLFRFIMIFFRLILFCIFSGLFTRGAHSWHLPHGRPAGSISRCVFPMAPRGMEGVGPDSPPPLPRRDIFIKKGGASPQRPTCSPNVSSYFKSLSDVEPNVGFS